MKKENVKIGSDKKEIASKTTTEVKETALTVIPKTEPNAEERNKILEAEIEKLKAKLNQEPQTLEEKIEYFKVKQQKIKQLSKLEESSEELFEHIEKLDNLATENEFECDKYKLSVNDTSSYKEAPVFQMNNPILIRDVIKFVLQRIDDKVDVLKMEIAE